MSGEAALGGRNTPWLMQAGTPSADIMIPLNK